jgi:hypothetical protein
MQVAHRPASGLVFPRHTPLTPLGGWDTEGLEPSESRMKYHTYHKAARDGPVQETFGVSASEKWHWERPRKAETHDGFQIIQHWHPQHPTLSSNLSQMNAISESEATNLFTRCFCR